MKIRDNKYVDMYSLFNTKNLPDYSFQITKHFLSEKFLISFDSIKDIISKCEAYNFTSTIVDNTYNAVYINAYGYSLSMVNNTTYGVYTRKFNLLSTDNTLISNLDSQIKFHCIIEALYTVCALLDNKTIPLSQLPITYTTKGYKNNRDKELKYPFLNYSSADNECVKTFRRAYNALLDPLSREFTNKTKSAKEKSINCLLANALNYSKDSSSIQIQGFLNEFSFDLLVNQTQIGFNLVNKLKAIQNNKYRPSYFRREVRRFLTGMQTIDDNFRSVSGDIDSLLYNWKKDHLFHLRMLSYLISCHNNNIDSAYAEKLLVFPTLASFSPLTTLLEELSSTTPNKENILFLLGYLSEITIPVFSYAFFISLYESLNNSLEDMQKILTTYLRKHSVQMESNQYADTTEQLNSSSIEQIGNILLYTYEEFPFLYLPHFDFSFTYNLPCNKEEISDPKYIQSDIGIKYYEIFLS